MQEFEILPENRLQEFEKSIGMDYRLLERNGDWVIYEQTNGRCYEVFRVRKHPEETFLGKQYPTRESFPASSEWGWDAFTFIKYKNAKERFDRTIENKIAIGVCPERIKNLDISNIIER